MASSSEKPNITDDELKAALALWAFHMDARKKGQQIDQDIIDNIKTKIQNYLQQEKNNVFSEDMVTQIVNQIQNPGNSKYYTLEQAKFLQEYFRNSENENIFPSGSALHNLFTRLKKNIAPNPPDTDLIQKLTNIMNNACKSAYTNKTAIIQQAKELIGKVDVDNEKQKVECFIKKYKTLADQAGGKPRTKRKSKKTV